MRVGGGCFFWVSGFKVWCLGISCPNSAALVLNQLTMCSVALEALGATIPRGSYPTPFLGCLVLWLGSVILKSRRPKKGVRYEPLGSV